MTHNNPLVIDSAEFFARVCCKVLEGGNRSSKSPDRGRSCTAIQGVPLFDWVKAGIGSVGKTSV